MSFVRWTLFALLVGPVVTLTGCASTVVSDSVRRELAPTGTLRAAINYNNPLLAKRDATTGELSGLAVDLSRELARRVGVPVELVPFDAAGKITASAKNNVWDVGYLAIDPLRANDIDFTAAHVEIEGTYLVPAGSPLKRIEDVDRDGVRIAVTANSAYDLFLSRELKHAQIVRAENTPKSMELMASERLDAVAAVRTALVAEAKRVPGARVLSGHFMTIPQAMGVPKGRPAAARYVREFVEDVKASGFMASALERHGLGPDEAVVASAASVKILASQVVQGAFGDVQPILKTQVGSPVSVEFGMTGSLFERVSKGESPQIVILSKQSIAQLAEKGRVKSRADICVSSVGIAVANDTPTPTMKTTEDFVAFLKAVPSIAYTAKGASGMHIAQTLEKLGLTDVVKPKAVISDGHTAELLVEGKVAAAVQQISELRAAGAKNIVPLPDSVQSRTTYTAAVLDDAGEAASKALKVLASREAIEAYVRSGLSAP